MMFMPYGQPGTGKSTLATGMALDYMREGRRVVANFPIDAAPASSYYKDNLTDAFCEVIPSRPSIALIRSLGFGWNKEEDFHKEDRAGLLIIDEAAGWIPARDWRAANRQELIDWFAQHRKYGWDVVLIAQHPDMIDSQVRISCVEVFGRIKRTDRKKVLGFKMPRFHFCIFRYGLTEKGQVLERKIYRGALEHRCFKSYATFNAEAEDGHYCTLPPRLTKWQKYLPRKRDLKPKHPLIDVLMKLPEEQRLVHWARLQKLGAFDVSVDRWKDVYKRPELVPAQFAGIPNYIDGSMSSVCEPHSLLQLVVNR